ncbi:hypothetical protein [Kitasatospora sp. NPDC051914]
MADSFAPRSFRFLASSWEPAEPSDPDNRGKACLSGGSLYLPGMKR